MVGIQFDTMLESSHNFHLAKMEVILFALFGIFSSKYFVEIELV
jgi:hypothetical protein